MTTVSCTPFGETQNGIKTTLYTLTNKTGAKVSITNYGATIVSIRVPDKSGNFDDVILGYDNVESYTHKVSYFGATIGRCCNRIGKAKFTLNGKVYNVAKNDGNNHLHGGNVGFNDVVWDAKIRKNDNGEYLTFHHLSPDGDENYPGNLDVNVSFTFDDNNSLEIHYYAICDQDTICNMTNHTYFNLSGHNSGDILNQEAKIYADYFTPSDKESIPTGEIKSVDGTPMDFREFHLVGERIDSDYDQLVNGHGYDHNYIINKTDKKLSPCGEFHDGKSGRLLTCLTTCPCVQFYTGNFINPADLNGKGDSSYCRRAGMCLETQYAPDAINKSNFKSTLLKAGEPFDEITVYKFSIK